MLAAARRLVVAVSAVAAVLALPGSALAADCPGADGAPAAADGVDATLCLVNAERAAQGLAPVAQSAQLGAAAGAHASAMVAEAFFSHESPDGGTLLDRLRTAGWLPATGGWKAGENIAWGSGSLGTPRKIVAAWMASPGHRANILTPAFDEIGLGVAAGAPQAGVPGAAATYVTDFGTRENGSAATAAVTPARKPAAKRCRTARSARASHGKRAVRALARCTRR
jgi:uncharacterized protein YkwD